jgi:hypothetical protein
MLYSILFAEYSSFNSYKALFISLFQVAFQPLSSKDGNVVALSSIEIISLSFGFTFKSTISFFVGG